MTITVKQLIKQLEAMNPMASVYTMSEDYHYLELEDDEPIVFENGIVALNVKYFYVQEE